MIELIYVSRASARFNQQLAQRLQSARKNNQHSDINHQIATAAEEQSSVANEIHKSLNMFQV